MQKVKSLLPIWLCLSGTIVNSVFSQIPNVYFPPQGATLNSNQIIFDWQKYNQGGTLEIEIGNDSLFQLSSTFFLNSNDTVTGLPSNSILFFHWRIPGGIWSETRWVRICDIRSLGGLHLWISADSGVVVENSTVKEWISQDSLQTLLSRDSPFNAPEFSPSFLNGKPAIIFGKNSTSPSMTFLNFSPIHINSNAFSFFALWRFNFSVINPLQYILGNIQEGIFAGGTLSTAGFRNMGAFKSSNHFGISNSQTFLTAGVNSIRPLSIRRNKTPLALSSNSQAISSFNLFRAT